MNNKIAYRFCFAENTFDGRSVCTFIKNWENYLGFSPSKIVNTRFGIYDPEAITDKDLEQIAGIVENISITLFDTSQEASFNINSPAKKISCQSITIYYPAIAGKLSDNIIDGYVSKDSFIVGYVYDPEFARWQSEINPSHYQIFNKPMTGVKLYWNSFFNEQQIDTSCNPARMTFVNGMWLTVSPIMYFGRPIFNYLPKSQIVENKISESVTTLNDNLVKVVLFDDILASDQPSNYQKLIDFRKLLKIDDLEAKLK